MNETANNGTAGPALPAVSAPSIPPFEMEGGPGATQSGALVRFQMHGKNLMCDIGFENDVAFDPTNIAHLLAWYVQTQAGHMISVAAKMYQTQASKLATLMKEAAEPQLPVSGEPQ